MWGSLTADKGKHSRPEKFSIFLKSNLKLISLLLSNLIVYNVNPGCLMLSRAAGTGFLKKDSKNGERSGFLTKPTKLLRSWDTVLAKASF